MHAPRELDGRRVGRTSTATSCARSAEAARVRATRNDSGRGLEIGSKEPSPPGAIRLQDDRAGAAAGAREIDEVPPALPVAQADAR